MTTLGKTHEVCIVCHRMSQHTVILSTNRFGAPDLDTRPPEMMRSTMRHWIRCCPHCGYCAGEVAKGPPLARQVTISEAYQKQLINAAFPELANHFLCSAMIMAAVENYPAAGMDCLRAAWACDDAQSPTAAAECRNRAITNFQAARVAGMRLGGQPGIDEAILADLYRRTGHFEQALAICQDGLALETEDILRRLFRFQIGLCQAGDTACHRVDEVPDEV